MTQSVALVTGAGRGIGAATARELARRGHHVVVNYRQDAESARRVVAAIEADGGSGVSVAADIGDPGQVAAMLAGLDQVDVLVCNANVGQPRFAGLESLSWPDFIGKVTGELAGAFFVTQRVLALMRARHRGRIVFVSSTAADYVGNGRLTLATAKSALNAFGRNVAAEAARYGVTVNIVAPGAVRTSASAAMLTADRERHLAEHSVLDRVLAPDDVAAVIGSLADQRMAPVAGAVIRVDAGFGVLVGGPS
jgi:3-oxoacyl-[acyl-carrier protein] reductase